MFTLFMCFVLIDLKPFCLQPKLSTLSLGVTHNPRGDISHIVQIFYTRYQQLSVRALDVKFPLFTLLIFEMALRYPQYYSR
jgi:hypothetical protein